MLKPEFINSLSYALGTLPQQERDKVISYYIELIDDKVESGKPEEEIIAEFGDINQLASTIISESSANNNQEDTSNKPKEDKKGISAWVIVLLILFSPVIFSLSIAFFSVIFVFIITVFALIFAFFAISAAFALSGVVLFFTSFILLVTEPAYALFQMGAGLLLAGLSIFTFMGTYYLTKGSVKLCGAMFRGIGKLFPKNKA